MYMMFIYILNIQYQLSTVFKYATEKKNVKKVDRELRQKASCLVRNETHKHARTHNKKYNEQKENVAGGRNQNKI